MIVFPIWFTLTAEELFGSNLIRPGYLADSDRHFVIAIDAIGNGVSCSPSNAPRVGLQFPTLAIADMVNSAIPPVDRAPGFAAGIRGRRHIDGRHANFPVDMPLPRFHEKSSAYRRIIEDDFL